MGEPSYHYNSMSCASSSEKSDMELSDEESPAPSSCSFRASSVAYFWMYSKEKGAQNDRQKEHGQTWQKLCVKPSFAIYNILLDNKFDKV